eukprot:3967814-Prymnesium_polylepis.1
MFYCQKQRKNRFAAQFAPRASVVSPPAPLRAARTHQQSIATPCTRAHKSPCQRRLAGPGWGSDPLDLTWQFEVGLIEDGNADL